MNNEEVLPVIKKYFEYWSYMVAHYGWKLTCLYHDSYDDMPSGTSLNAAAKVIAEFKYLEAVIHVNLKATNDLDENEIEEVVVHELVHLLVSPLVESSEETPKEYTVTTIARIIKGLRHKND